LNDPIQVAFASSSDDLVPTLLEKMRGIYPELSIYVVSEFPVEGARWVPYHVRRTFGENLALCRSVFAGKHIRLAGVILQPRMPYWKMRWLAIRLAGPLRIAFFNDNLDHFMLRPRSAGTMVRHGYWRLRNLVRWELRPGGSVYTFFWRLAHPSAFLRPIALSLARFTGFWLAAAKRIDASRPQTGHSGQPAFPRSEGISVIVPSRDGRHLLARLLPGLLHELNGVASEVIVVDNGSYDGTSRWLAAEYPQVVVEHNDSALSFARAVNRGIRRSRFAKVLLINNDMTVEPGFFPPLLAAFRAVPDLFCATAQILFPEGERRQETGKAVMTPQPGIEDFPVRCDTPLPGEDHSYVLYGSGGCSLFDAGKLLELGGFNEIYEPAYVEDLDLGYRGWQRAWPTVFVAGAQVIHRHRATTSRYFTQRELDRVLEINYLKFLASAVQSGTVFARLWARAIQRLNARASRMIPEPGAMFALRRAWTAPRWIRQSPIPRMDEEAILAIGSGDVAVFPGVSPRLRPLVLLLSPYLPFPLSHGGAVRMYNLMRRASADYDQVLVCFVDDLAPPPPELLDLCVEIVTVRRQRSHARPLTNRPDTVEEFDSLAFHEGVRLTARKWRPVLAQLEFTQMAQYSADCGGVPTILVEHDVTLDLYSQLLARGEDWETRTQHERWVDFENRAWDEVASIVVMSEKDRRSVARANAVVIPNGVDLDRFQPSDCEPDPDRILFIGSFAHLPNVIAIDWFLREVWPLLHARREARLHVIAGARSAYFLERYRETAQPPLEDDSIEFDDFVADPRPAYARASVVIAPLLASAGTNIKIMEGMAMGRAIVSTPAGINGLDDLADGRDLLVARTPVAMASAIASLLEDPARRRGIERQARETVERLYGWDAIGLRQRALYARLTAGV
jgi:glycosyltransferase involved in cell wall biosynthesis/GT2 family glycosyltransferase